MATITIILLLAGLFIVTGLALSQDFRKSSTFPLTFHIASSYFLGLTAFLCGYRLLGFILPARSAAYLAVVLCSVLSIWYVFYTYHHQLWSVSQVKSALHLHLRQLLWAAGLGVILWLSMFLQWLPTGDVPADPFIHYGSVHSGRAVNIAQYIYNTDSIPVLPQHYGQALLVAVVDWLGSVTPYSSLWLWLSMTMSWFAVLIYSVLRFFKLSVRSSLGGAILVMLGNTALSLTNVLTIDSFSPLFRTGYSDTLVAIATLLIALLILRQLLQPVLTRITLMSGSILLALIGFSWNIFATQNIILFASVFAVTMLFRLKQRAISWSAIIVGLVFIVASVLGSRFGGMLTLHQFHDEVVIPGVLVAPLSTQVVLIQPEWPYQYYDGLNPLPGTSKDDQVQVDPKHLQSADFSTKLLWKIETNSWSAVRVIFWPLLGWVMLGILLYRRRQDVESALTLATMRQGWWATGIVLGVGGSIAFWLQLDDFKWALSRFVTPFYALGLIGLVLAFAQFNKLWARNQRMLVSVALAFLLLVGPVTYLATVIYYNIITDSWADVLFRAGLFFQH